MIGARCCYVLYCTDLHHLYDLFLSTVHMLIDRCVPVKYISLGPHDPAYVTPGKNVTKDAVQASTEGAKRGS